MVVKNIFAEAVLRPIVCCAQGNCPLCPHLSYATVTMQNLHAVRYTVGAHVAGPPNLVALGLRPLNLA